MRWLILVLYFFLVGCISSAFSGANVVYKHKELQDEMSDYYINVKSWNTLKPNFSENQLKNVHLTSFHKVVLLTGEVPNQSTREQIEQTLRCIPSIARIYNATSTEPPATTQEQIRDSWLTTKIKSKMIASNELYADKIRVVTEKRIVYLMGIVTREEADEAICIAKDTEGVAKVVTIFYYMTMPKIE